MIRKYSSIHSKIQLPNLTQSIASILKNCWRSMMSSRKTISRILEQCISNNSKVGIWKKAIHLITAKIYFIHDRDKEGGVKISK